MSPFLKWLAEQQGTIEPMSANMEEAIERQRKLLYADKTDEQLIMIALHYLLISVSCGHDALLRELYDRYSTRLEAEK